MLSRNVSDVLRCPSSCWVFAFIGVENVFSPSVAKSKHGWRTAMHLEGRNEVENRNGACVMEVASLGSRAKMTRRKGENKKSLGWKVVKPRPICS